MVDEIDLGGTETGELYDIVWQALKDFEMSNAERHDVVDAVVEAIVAAGWPRVQ